MNRHRRLLLLLLAGLIGAAAVSVFAVVGTVNDALVLFAKRPPVPLGLPPSMSNVVEHVAQHLRGFVGVALGTDLRSGLPMVSVVYPNSPGQAAGLQAGDLIVQVDGRETRRLPLLDVTRMIRGKPNTEVVLAIQRPGQRVSIEVKVSRISQKRLFENLARPQKTVRVR